MYGLRGELTQSLGIRYEPFLGTHKAQIHFTKIYKELT
jgi:hypothetical protein